METLKGVISMLTLILVIMIISFLMYAILVSMLETMRKNRIRRKLFDKNVEILEKKYNQIIEEIEEDEK